MVFRKDSKVDAFQRQISALRHQLGGETDLFSTSANRLPPQREHSVYRGTFPDLDSLGPETSLVPSARETEGGFLNPTQQSSAVPAVDTHTSVIAHSTAWNGNLESSGSLHVHGRVEGSVHAREQLFIAEEADVEAVITAASVTVAGNVRGAITCADRLEVLPRGRVAGDIEAPVIVIHEGAVVTGAIVMTKAHDGRSAPASPPLVRAVQGGD